MRVPGVGDSWDGGGCEAESVVQRAEKLWNWPTSSGPCRLLPKAFKRIYLGEAEGATEGEAEGAAPMARVWDLVVLVAMTEGRL